MEVNFAGLYRAEAPTSSRPKPKGFAVEQISAAVRRARRARIASVNQEFFLEQGQERGEYPLLAPGYASGFKEVFQDWINGTEQTFMINAVRDICMSLRIAKKIDPKTYMIIYDKKALERFNEKWPENAGIHQVDFGKLLQTALNNLRDPKSRKRFDDAHMKKATENLETGRNCWPLIPEEEERNCREVAEIVVIATAVLLKAIESQHGNHKKLLNGTPIDTRKLPSSKDISRFAEGQNFRIIDGYDVNKMIAGLEEIEAANRIHATRPNCTSLPLWEESWRQYEQNLRHSGGDPIRTIEGHHR